MGALGGAELCDHPHVAHTLSSFRPSGGGIQHHFPGAVSETDTDLRGPRFVRNRELARVSLPLHCKRKEED